MSSEDVKGANLFGILFTVTLGSGLVTFSWASRTTVAPALTIKACAVLQLFIWLLFLNTRLLFAIATAYQ